MSAQHGKLPDNVLAALRQDKPLEAIKLLSENTGLGIKECKEVIDGCREDSGMFAVEGSHELPESVRSALQHGSKVEAIRLLREQTGMGLKEAKDAVEGVSPAPEPPHIVQVVETPWAGRRVWWLSALLLAGYATYFWLARNG